MHDTMAFPHIVGPVVTQRGQVRWFYDVFLHLRRIQLTLTRSLFVCEVYLRIAANLEDGRK